MCAAVSLWAGVKLFTNPHSSQCSVSQVPGHKQEPSPGAAPPFHQGVSLVCRETVSQGEIPQETAACTTPGWGGDVTQRGTAQPFPWRSDTAVTLLCTKTEWDGICIQTCILFQSWLLKNSGCLPDQKSRTLPLCLLFFLSSLFLSKVVGQGILQRPRGCPFQQQIKAAGQVHLLPISLILADWFCTWEQFLFLTTCVNSSGSSNRQVASQSKDCPEFICASSQTWKSPENRFACEHFQELLAFELNRCQRNKFEYQSLGPELLPVVWHCHQCEQWEARRVLLSKSNAWWLMYKKH